VGRVANFFAAVQSIGKDADCSGNNYGIGSFEPGIDYGCAAGRADLNIAADQCSRHRLAAGELDDFKVLDPIFLEIVAFLCGPKRRLSGGEHGSGARRLLGDSTTRTDKNK